MPVTEICEPDLVVVVNQDSEAITVPDCPEPTGISLEVPEQLIVTTVTPDLY